MAQTVNELMTHDPRTCEPSTPLTELAKEMKASDAGIIPITEDGRFHGVVTDRDIVVRAIAEGRDPSSTTAGEIATTGVTTITPDSDLNKAVALMKEKAVRRIPVVQDDRLVGILSLGDAAIQGHGEEALDDISSAPPNN